jgi:hypothetical protein
MRHPVIRDEHRDGVAAQLEFFERLESVGARLGPQDAVPLPVVSAKVAGDRAGHCWVIVDCEDCGSSGLISGFSHRH